MFLGYEFAGIVESVGKKFKNLKEGDRILCLKNSATGAFAQYCIVYDDIDLIVKLPYSINYEIAASVSLAYGTAYLGLKNLVIQQKGLVFFLLYKFYTLENINFFFKKFIFNFNKFWHSWFSSNGFSSKCF